MDRRGFLRLFGLGAAGVALEQAIPLGRVWSFPSKIVVPTSGNLFLRTEWITAETLRMLKQNLRDVHGFEWFEEERMYREFKVGSTINVKLPQRWIIRDSLLFTPFPPPIEKLSVSYSGGPPTAPPVAQLKSGLPFPARGMPES